MEVINAFGLQCPKPLMLAKQQIDAGVHEFGIQVDNETAVKNVSRLAERTGLACEVAEIAGGWLVSFSEGDADLSNTAVAAPAAAAPAAAPACVPGVGCGYAVFVGKDHVGEGEGELGYNLMKMALYTLSEADEVPSSLLFMNGGVKLIAGPDAEQQCVDNVTALQEKGTEVLESVQKLIDQGTEVLVCGTCLDFYGLKEQLQVGDVSNMYDILERMRDAAKVITL